MSVRHIWSAVWAIGALLLVSLIWSAVQVGWRMAGHTDVVPLDVSVRMADAVMPGVVNLEAITGLAPFGATLEDRPVSVQRARAAEVNIVLHGVLWDVDPARSRAILAVGGARDVYRIGDMVRSVEVLAIGVDTVTVMSGEKRLTIGFEGARDAEVGTGAGDGASSSEATLSPFERLAAAIVPGQGSIELRETPPPETMEDYINLWRERITRNPQTAMEMVGLELVENGYKVAPEPNIGVTMAGLRPGDVITRLNGQSIGDVERDRQLYDEVAASGMARLEVVRDGQSLLLTFPLR